MPGTRLIFAIRFGILLGTIAVLATSCNRTPVADEPIDLKLHQNWQLQPGDNLGGYSVVGGLGDISIALNGKPIFAPFAGRSQKDVRNCLIFSTPDVPAYAFRLCGVNDLQLGVRNQGEALGSASMLQIATLRKQPDGKWAIVEPSKSMLERFLTKL